VEHEEWLALAEMFALGVLEGSELAEFKAHLAPCAQCKEKIRETSELFSQFPESLEPLPAPQAVKSRIFAEIDQDKPGHVFVHAQDGEWRAIASGIIAKVLALDESHKKVTVLMRMEKGARYVDHRHTLTEEMFVIEGSCFVGGRLLKAGDYHRAEAGSVHLNSYTDEGALMLVIASTENELLF
jgi:anti-sigma factor ChrR (cupin superfamily)